MRSALAIVSCLAVGLAAGLAPSDAGSGDELSAAGPAAGDSPELEAAAAALAGLLAAGAGDEAFGRQRRADGPVTVDAGSPDWIMGLGVLSNMQQFFDNLKNNLESLESLPKEEREVLLGQTATASAARRRSGCGAACCRCWRERSRLATVERAPRARTSAASSCVVTPQQERAYRPRATAAYLHALRNHRPSHKIRNFVAEPEPASLRGSNHYDPNWLWTGLGRRR